MEINRINYPSDDFYKFGESHYAVDIDDEQIEEWVNECVISVKEQDDVFNDSNYFSVIVAKNYESADLFIEDIKKGEKDEEIALLKKQIENLQKEIERLS